MPTARLSRMLPPMTMDMDTPLSNWWLAALNYTGLNVMCAVSMSIVIGGLMVPKGIQDRDLHV